MSGRCQVCGASSGQYHFGAVVCRACAAFFRRYVNSKKTRIVCTCNAFTDSQYPCRLCRMKKCVAVGMQQSKVQKQRDVNQMSRIRKMEIIGIKFQNGYRIRQTTDNYILLETARKMMFGTDRARVTGEVDLYEWSMECKTDAKLLWKLCETTFSEFSALSREDKSTLFFNFYPKWTIFEMAMFSAKNKEPHKLFSPSGAVAAPIERFYVQKQKALSDEDLRRIFQPFWTQQIQHVTAPLVKLGFGDVENSALLGIMLWDAGYTNVGDSLAETCRAMRKIICRELNAYFEELEEVSGSRLFETLDSLNIIERAEIKCLEEIQLCGVYDIKVEDTRNLIMWQKY